MAVIFTDLGVVVFSASTAGQLLEKGKFSAWFFVLGLFFSIFLFYLAIYFDNEEV